MAKKKQVIRIDPNETPKDKAQRLADEKTLREVPNNFPLPKMEFDNT